MKKSILILFAIAMTITACKNNEEVVENNPLLNSFGTEYNVPPFDKIHNKHYLPAFDTALARHNQEIAAIVNLTEAPSFENTIIAYDNAGALLNDISSIFYNLLDAHTNDSLREIAGVIAPKLSTHYDEILLNDGLFKRIEEVYNNRESLDLNTEQLSLLDKIYKNFYNNGATLSVEDKTTLKEINSKIAELTLEFGNNVLDATNAWYLLIDNQDDLAGLPQSLIDAAAATAEAKGETGKWVFTLSKSSMIPFLQFADNRDLREEIYTHFINRANGGDFDNTPIIKEIANLRLEKANLLGFNSYAAYALQDRIAKNLDNTYELLDQIWEPAIAKAEQEAQVLQNMIISEGNDFELAGWDWWYYTEKVRKAQYDLDEESIKPYFSFDNALYAVTTTASRLYGIKFIELENMPKYHEDQIVFQVTEEDGTHIGVLYVDPYARDSKSSGAWMESFRKQSRRFGEDVPPVITTCENFPPPVGDKPSLITFEQVTTLFHEFGHCLHGLLSDCDYHTLSGTSVLRDFVEFPSQVMENWAANPDFIREYAKHYETGEVIPDELITKLEQTSTFNQGFVTAEYLSACYLDFAWHSIETPFEGDVNQFETNAMSELGLINEITVRYRSTYFKHIFTGDSYAAGYYVYIWAEVFSADAYKYFEENGVFNKELSQSLRDNVLSKGGSDKPMVLYKNFRGQEPSVDALLISRGLY